MDNLQKAEILRQHETYCYQVCYCLIQDEQQSFQAASRALLEVARDPVFFTDTVDGQKKKVVLAAVRCITHARSDQASLQ
ncbi:hypothetical protein [Paenibacillus senegalensis]|uniref:hypothetical protein n=1 Tax=Paenibacillus senegalensis TaxID=1465766 RepID=UPI000289EE6D|nr:hypothetical protein [Paenibacillus senegalensis]